jgi:hypothetical protein
MARQRRWWHVLDAHGESVEVLVEGVEEVDGLNDHVVGAVDVELDLAAGVGVTQTQLSLLVVTLLEGFDELGEVKADAPRELGHGLALNAGNLLERIVDGATQLFVSHAQLHLALLLARGQVELQEVLEDIVHET